MSLVSRIYELEAAARRVESTDAGLAMLLRSTAEDLIALAGVPAPAPRKPSDTPEARAERKRRQREKSRDVTPVTRDIGASSEMVTPGVTPPADGAYPSVAREVTDAYAAGVTPNVTPNVTRDIAVGSPPSPSPSFLPLSSPQTPQQTPSLSPPATPPATGSAASESTAVAVQTDQKPERRKIRTAVVRGREAADVRNGLTLWWETVKTDEAERRSVLGRREHFAEMVFVYWAEAFDHGRALLDPKRLGVLMDRLKENRDDLSELLYVIDGARDDRYVKEGHNDIDFLYQKRGTVERWAGKVPRYKRGEVHPSARKVFEHLAAQQTELAHA